MEKIRKFFEIVGLVTIAFLILMLYVHRRVIIAKIKGEPMPEPSKWAKKFCPPVRKAEKVKTAQK